MAINETVLRKEERTIFALREQYAAEGYLPYRMSKFEEYDLYAQNKEFLVSDNVITFNDPGGRLMALKPDVTLSIIKNTRDEGGITKLYYDENVYRVRNGADSFGEIMQSGVECIGSLSESDIADVIRLAVRSLSLLDDACVIEVSDLDILEEIICRTGVEAKDKAALYRAIAGRNETAIAALVPDASALLALLSLSGTVSEVLPDLRSITGECRFIRLLAALSDTDEASRLRVDFSVTGDIRYYNGVVFKGYIKGVPEAAISGGQYDRLMKKMHRTSSAIGFAVYLDAVSRVEKAARGKEKTMLNVALPKGRLGEKVYAMFDAAGFPCPAILEQNRKLIFENEDALIRYFWVKPSDVAIYVERGAADIGVAGKDILLEYEPEVFELLDLGLGKCRMAVAAPLDFTDDGNAPLRVATKFSKIAAEYYRGRGRDIDIIHLNGSIEIAPILGLSDVIVDIVETGTTLKENQLEVKEEILPISARLIANKAAFRFKEDEIRAVMAGLAKIKEAEA